MAMAIRILSRLRYRLLTPSVYPIYQIIQSNSQTEPTCALNKCPYITISHRSFWWWGGHSGNPDSNASHTFIQEQEDEKDEENWEHENELSEPSEPSNTGSGFEDITDILDNSSAMGSASHGIGIGWHTPGDAMIAFFDGFNNLTGLPWWLSIVASTVVIRLAMLPVLVLQISKISSILKMRSKLEPYQPMPGSNFLRQFAIFRRQRRAIGCPTLLWVFATPAIQIPIFLCSMYAIRSMCMDHHPGFDNGGTLWFVDLTECIHGPLGMLFAISIAGVYLLNVQLSLGTVEQIKSSGLLSIIRKFHRVYLQSLTVPIFILGAYMPQGVLIFMLSNHAFSTMQILLQRHLSYSMMSGLNAHQNNPETAQSIRQCKNREMMDQLSSAELLALAAQHVARGHLESALQVLRAAIEKDPERSEHYIAMGTIQLKKKLFDEAFKQFELAISKAKDDDVLVTAHLYASTALLGQEKMLEAITHLRKITEFEEPAEPKSKHFYYKGFALLASILFRDGRKDEAAHYVRIAAKYDPSLNKYLQECEEIKNNEREQ